MAMTGVG